MMWTSQHTAHSRLCRPLAVILLLAVLPVAAHASDGVIEINQVRALAGGISSTDTPGFPVTLSSGSYRLTGNLQGTSLNVDPDTHIIEITGSSVTLDLGGFTVASWASCTGMPNPGCTSGGSGWGIYAAPSVPISPREHTVITNGFVRSTFAGGIAVNGWARVEGVAVRRTGGVGIAVGDKSIVTESSSRDNVSVGISAGFGAIVTNTLVDSNGILDAPGAVGADGVVLISQELALAGGVAPGDAPGFPVTLPSGNYRLISDLTLNASLGDENTHVIHVVGDDTAIDLAGFTVSSYANCEGAPNPGCTSVGGGAGIVASANTNVHVKNGTVHSTFNTGVFLGDHGRAEKVIVHSTGGHGVYIDDFGQISQSAASNNALDGLRARRGAVIDGLAQANGKDGIVAVMVADSTSFGNGEIGINARIAHSNVSIENSNGIVADVARGNYIWDVDDNWGLRAGVAVHNAIGQTAGSGGDAIGIDAYGPTIANYINLFGTGLLVDGVHRDNELAFNTTQIAPSSTGLETGLNACGDVACP